MAKHKYTNKDATRNGKVLRTARFDLRCKPQVYARVWKMFTNFKKVLNAPDACCADVFEDFCLMLLEHCARELKIKGKQMEVVLKLARPLPKSEWLNRKNNKTDKENKQC